jgi:hypothetical protein
MSNTDHIEANPQFLPQVSLGTTHDLYRHPEVPERSEGLEG